MKETGHITELFKDLYNGSPWLDVTIMETIKELNSSRAQFRISEQRNSIWEILNHTISWRETVLKRVQGENIPSPEHNYFLPVKDRSESAWEETVVCLENSQKNWINFLSSFEDNELDNVSPFNGTLHYKHIHGVIQHDAYHLGQLVILIKIEEESS